MVSICIHVFVATLRHFDFDSFNFITRWPNSVNGCRHYRVRLENVDNRALLQSPSIITLMTIDTLPCTQASQYDARRCCKGDNGRQIDTNELMFSIVLCFIFIFQIIYIDTFKNSRLPWEVAVIPGDRRKLDDTESLASNCESCQVCSLLCRIHLYFAV